MSSSLDLLAGMAHDLRTPLARLRLRAELECPQEVARAMEDDFQAVTHLIDQILGYAQGCMAPAAGRSQPLAELIGQTVRRYGQAHDVSVLRLDACEVQVPGLSVQRALANLIDNALAHGAGAVQVELHADADAFQVLVFDHGQGLGPEQWARAGEPFVRLGTVPGQGQGPSVRHCGLGLAIVAQMARQLGGRMVLHPFDGTRSGIGVLVPR